MRYNARLGDRFLWTSDGSSFSFLTIHCYSARDGQDEEFTLFFDRFPEGTTRVSYDEDSGTGIYCINGGEEISEDGDLRCSHLKTMFESNVAMLEHMEDE
jgi:hypothetical protein